MLLSAIRMYDQIVPAQVNAAGILFYRSTFWSERLSPMCICAFVSGLNSKYSACVLKYLKKSSWWGNTITCQPTKQTFSRNHPRISIVNLRFSSEDDGSWGKKARREETRLQVATRNGSGPEPIDAPPRPVFSGPFPSVLSFPPLPLLPGSPPLPRPPRHRRGPRRTGQHLQGSSSPRNKGLLEGSASPPRLDQSKCISSSSLPLLFFLFPSIYSFVFDAFHANSCKF